MEPTPGCVKVYSDEEIQRDINRYNQSAKSSERPRFIRATTVKLIGNILSALSFVAALICLVFAPTLCLPFAIGGCSTWLVFQIVAAILYRLESIDKKLDQ